MPIVQIITTGGTIASRVDPATGAAVPVVRPEELVAQVPALANVAELRITEFSLVSSWDMTPTMMANLARKVREALTDPAVCGAVVTHGTDTMEETVFALDLLLEEPAPVVVTGAMRNPSLTGPDGPRNLLAAVRVAADPAARGLGAVLVLNDEIHAARYVTKSHTTALDTFVSRGLGPIGLVDDEGVWLRWQPVRLPSLPMADPEKSVYLIKSAAGMDDLLLRAVLEAGGRGVVIEGSGAGHVLGSWQPTIEALIQRGVPVVLVSRCGGGRVVGAYGGRGGGKTLRALGIIPAGDLSGQKARVALSFALGAGLNVDEIRSYFARVAGNREGVGAI
ncbi:MAG: asparaginase [Chloroflexi bacterium]|nr:asparaginase [Chloroflexota bacterium]